MAEPVIFGLGRWLAKCWVAAWALLLCWIAGLSLLVWGPGPLIEEKTVIISPGHASAVAEKLAESGVIWSSQLFRAAVRLTRAERQLKSGEYQFAPQISLMEVISQLCQGSDVLHRLTVPEGWNSHKIAQFLESHPLLEGILGELPPEGTLLPDTYLFARGSSPQKLVDTMQQAMGAFLAEAWAQREGDLPLATPLSAVILASIVELEAGAGEHARVAGVFINRLRQDMKLQSDPTVIYALTQGERELGRALTRADLLTQSPYNTYRVAGLPPQPITNPGRESILASLHPERHRYLYFVAGGAGRHDFATTLAEHHRNVERHRQAR